MSFNLTISLPLYSGVTGLSVSITAPGSPTLVNGSGDSLTESSNGIFSATVAEDLVGSYTYVVKRSSTPVQSGWFRRAAAQASVLADDERDLLAAIAAIEPPRLPGAFTRTMLVRDVGTNQPIAGAIVRLYRTGETETQSTGNNGTRDFATGAYTYQYTVTAQGYQPVTGSITANSDGTTTVSLTPTIVTIADAPACSVTIPLRSQFTDAAAGAKLHFEFVKFLGAQPSLVLDLPTEVVANGQGVATVTLYRNAAYRMRYLTTANNERKVSFSTPNSGAFTLTGAS